ncbi:Hypothetical predicted protein [Lynx pardinus]|uniref:Uncharacterized protein n=1 Tax=Lynx pardinus TaxID=191816 RepID=A0A485N0L2_LYNPA|nr:Hypothetical predicted protein [Lynx pardinus]
MRRQRNIFQMKEQDKTSEKELNETEISNRPDKEFKVMVIKMLTKLRRRININQSEPKNTITEMKNTLQETKSRLDANIKWAIISIIGVPEEKERKKGAENLLEEIIAENLPNLGKETDIPVQE